MKRNVRGNFGGGLVDIPAGLVRKLDAGGNHLRVVKKTDEVGRLCRMVAARKDLAVHGLESDIRHGGQVNILEGGAAAFLRREAIDGNRSIPADSMGPCGRTRVGLGTRGHGKNVLSVSTRLNA